MLRTLPNNFNMYSRITSASVIGVEGFLVDIDVYISNESSSNKLFSLTERRILSVIRNKYRF
ncbi:MAG: hypothetical protein ABIL45_02245 [candidate division WOR-3 bacterium]